MGIPARASIDELFQLKGATREAKAYAFLYAAFRKTEISANPVRDALDCLIPFIAPYTNQIAGKQVTTEGIQVFLKESYGFDIPHYAIDQLVRALQQHGFVAYRQNTKTYVAVAYESTFNVIKSEIEIEFDDIVQQLSDYAKSVGFNLSPPPSGSWGSALIGFLRVSTDKNASPQFVLLKNVLTDPGTHETAVVGAFIRRLHTTTPDQFGKIVNIFIGVLIEEFISSVAEIGTLSLEKPVTVFYDTAVILRQLGCSGRSLAIATEELTRYIQDLGMQIRYFSGNEQEVANILNTIVYIKDAGKELEGETATAIADGEVSTVDLRMLQNTFPEQLAKFNIFPAGELETGALAAAKYQIDELDFSNYLFTQSKKSGRAYGQQNRVNDAGYLAAVMRLRRGNRPRDLAECAYVFVTSNTFLAYTSRRFLIDQRALGFNNFPPIISLGQIATIAWLLKDQTIPPEKAGRELLANCFAAVRPDAEWFKYFREGMEKQVSKGLDDYAQHGTNGLTIQAARRIAQEESFGNSAIVRQLNMAEILSRAEVEQRRLAAEYVDAIERERARGLAERAVLVQSAEEARIRALEQAETRHAEFLNSAIEKAKQEVNQKFIEKKQHNAKRRAHTIVLLIKFIFLFLTMSICIVAFYLQNIEAKASSVIWMLSGVMLFFTAVSFADMFRIRFIDSIFDKVHRKIAKIIEG